MDKALKDIEKLFIEKLQEKYKLTERDIQRAFKKFDTDGSGFLSVNELQKAMQLYLNGVDSQLVQALVTSYDVNGDNEIGIDEFAQMLISRETENGDAMAPKNTVKTFGLSAYDKSGRFNSNTASNDQRADEPAASSSPALRGAVDGASVEDKAKMFLQNVRAILVEQALDMKIDGSVSTKLGPSSKADRLNHRTEYAESIARQLLLKAFHCDPNSSRKSLASFPLFSKILSRFTRPGSLPLPQAVIEEIYCMAGGSIESGDLNTTASLADPILLTEIVFHKGEERINQFGFRIEPAAALTSTGRPRDGRGPIVRKPGENSTEISSVPFRFITRHCRSALATPSNFSVDLIERSAKTPNFSYQREFVFGLNSNLYSGQNIQSLSYDIAAASNSEQYSIDGSSSKIAYASASVGVLHDLSSNTQRFLDGHTDDITCLSLSPDRTLAASGQMGRSPEVLVWDLSDMESATGDGPRGVKKPVARAGKGFFSRGVCAVQFSFDNAYIVGVSCDDKHTIGVWALQLSRGEGEIDKSTELKLIASMTAANGIPPQILSLRWAPCFQNTQYVSNEVSADSAASINGANGRRKGGSAGSSGLTDLFVTAGEKHLKFWAFKRPTKGDSMSASLYGRNSRMGIVKATAPKSYLCADFVSPDVSFGIDDDPAKSSAICDIITGGDNGYIYRWREGCCIQAAKIASTGDKCFAINCLAVAGAVNARGKHVLFCGASNGNLYLVDASGFNILSIFSVSAASVSGVPTDNSGASRLGLGGDGGGSGGRAATAGVGGVVAHPQSALRARSSSSSGPRSSGRSGSALVVSNTAANTNAGTGVAGAPSLKSRDSARDGGSGGIKKGGGPTKARAKAAWKGPGEDDPKMSSVPDNSVSGSPAILGLALEYEPTAQGSSSKVAAVFVTTGFGRVFRVVLQQKRGTVDGVSIEPLFCHHYGSLYALCADDRTRQFRDMVVKGTLSSSAALKVIGGSDLFVTGGDDKWLCVWCSARRQLIIRIKTQYAIACCDIHSFAFLCTGADGVKQAIVNGNKQMPNAYSPYVEGCIAVGHTGGAIAIYLLFATRGASSASDSPIAPKELEYSLSLLCSRKDCSRDISDVKFSPNGKMLAVGSHDDVIDIYHHKYVISTRERNPQLELKYLKRLRGHSSFITHLDWSYDNRVLRSNCASYELMYWDVSTGQHMMRPSTSSVSHAGPAVEADILWHTNTCVLGFPLMAIWPPDADGTDINAVDVNEAVQLVATADDFGDTHIFNYPCVAKSAPGLTLCGHSSHVQNVKFLSTNANSAIEADDVGLGASRRRPELQPQQRGGATAATIVTVGGNDRAAMLWKLYD